MTASRRTWGRRLGVVLLILAAGAWAQASALRADVTPGVPGGLTAIALDGSVGLAWQAVDGATSYRVYRGTAQDDITTLIGSPTATTFTDDAAANDTKYFYAVRAANGAGASDPGQITAARPRARTCSGSNAVAQENCFPGDAGWKTTDARRTYDDGIEGYATAASVDAGGSVDLKVDTANDYVPFHVDIYRTGWYGGAQGRLVSTIPARQATWQPECVSDPGSTGITDCSGWSAKATVTTTAAWPSGVYLLKLTREDNDAHGEILLVVRHDGSHSPLAYKVPTNTYQAYNNWGGKSIYDFNSSAGDTALSHGPRAVKVSYDRPYAQLWTGAWLHDYYPRTDVAAVSWLEHQGYDLSYVADPDVDRDPDQLQDHDVVVSAVHDEYWTQGIRDAFQAARDHGTSLVFLGANASFWRARYAAGTDRRTLVEYKTTQGGDPDPSGPTATWRDPAGPNKPENALVGQMYAGDNGGSAWGLKVSGAEGRNRVWRHTTLGDQAPGATTTLGTGLVGWEWDKRVANGEEPAGVTTLASTPVDGGIAQGSGAANVPGATTQMSTIYTAPSGAIVFDTGTNLWARGLAPNVDGTEDANGRIRQATANVLADMGAVATTPDPALAFDEPGPPQVTGGVPAAGETGVAPGAAITATFDRELDPSTVDGDTVTLTTGGDAVAAEIAWDRASRTITVTPAAPLAEANYTLTLGTGLKGWAGVGLAAPVTRAFTPGAGAPPTLTTTSPADGATAVPTDATATATANRALDPNSVSASTVSLHAGAGAPVAAAVAYDAATRTISVAPAGALAEATTYTVTLDGVQAAGGAPMATTSWTFTTSTNLRVSGQSPAPLATGVSPAADVRVTFSRAIDVATLTAARLVLEDADGDAVATQLSYDPTSRTATLTPSAPLAFMSSFRVRVAAGIRAADGAPIDPALWWFSTAQAPPTAPTVTALLPTAGATDAFNGTTVKATFDRDLAAATVTTQSFTLTTAAGAPVAATVSYDAAGRQAVLRPLAQLATDATYTATLSTAIADAGGTPLDAPVSWTFTTARCPCSLLAGQTPAETGLSGTFELGVRVTSQVDADLVAVRFYKSPGETGMHVGRVWNAAGQLLGQATFANETASGWQRQALAAPIGLAAGQVYTVSVNANSKWAKTGWTMRDPIASGPLSSLADGTNGVYNDAPGLFPASTYQWTNYFIDPVVRIATAPARVPQVTSIVPAAGATGVATSAPVRITFTQPLDEATIDAGSVRLTDAADATVPAALSYDDDARTVTLTPTASLAPGAAYTVRLSTGLRSDDETPLAAAVTSAFATASNVIAPAVASTAPGQGATGVAIGAAPALTFDQRMDPATLTGATVTLTGPAGAAVAATLGVSGDGRTVTATPAVPLTEATTYTLTVTTGAHSDTGAALANSYHLVFTTGSSCPCRLWGANPSPAATTLDVANGRSGGGPYSLELGVKFRVSRAATLNAVRFYKDPWETAGHTARLWSSDGSLIATVAFGTESGQGWQRVALSTPVALTAGQTYVLSVGVNSKFGMSANSPLGAGVTDGPLASVVDGANGVYADAAGTFPTQTWGNSNYFVDPEVQ